MSKPSPISYRELVAAIRKDDLLIITADHGCDPTIISIRGHTREFVPLLIFSKKFKSISKNIGIRKTFADIGQTICYNFSLPRIKNGTPIYEIF